jgi:hypothetical protein
MRSDELSNWVLIAVVGIGGYALYRVLTKVGQQAGAAAQTIWNNLVESFSGPDILAGIHMPDGTTQPVGAFTVKTDNAHNWFVQYNGTVYVLNGPDDIGNYTGLPYNGTT